MKKKVISIVIKAIIALIGAIAGALGYNVLS